MGTHLFCLVELWKEKGEADDEMCITSSPLKAGILEKKEWVRQVAQAEVSEFWGFRGLETEARDKENERSGSPKCKEEP